jgi:phosphoglycerate dehydrogenase-like enzyme
MGTEMGMDAREDGSAARPAVNEGGRVLITAPGFDVAGVQAGAQLRQAGLTIDNAGAAGSRRPEDMVRLVGDAVAAIVSSDPFTEAVFAAAPRLRVLARLGVGTDSVDIDAATRAGVAVTTTPGLNDQTCADHTLALLLAAIRRITEHDASVRRGEWDRGVDLTPGDLHGTRVGVVGYGRIGRNVVRRLQGFDAEIKVFDPLASPPADLACPALGELLGWAEVVTLHAPLVDSTRSLIGAPELAAMKPSAILVNTSRGSLIDEQALVQALVSGRIRGAALDVFAHEPPTTRALLKLPNVVLSPHIGGLSTGAIRAMASECARQVLAVLDGAVPDGVVNPGVLEEGVHRGGAVRRSLDATESSP